MNDIPAGKNTGHGHVFPRPDGMKARCGGPGLCLQCASDLAEKQQREKQEKSDLPAEAITWRLDTST